MTLLYTDHFSGGYSDASSVKASRILSTGTNARAVNILTSIAKSRFSPYSWRSSQYVLFNRRDGCLMVQYHDVSVTNKICFAISGQPQVISSGELGNFFTRTELLLSILYGMSIIV